MENPRCLKLFENS